MIGIIKRMHKKRHEQGIALLVTLLLMSVLLGITSSLLNVTLNQYQLARIAEDSEMAFEAANAGMDCIAWLNAKNPPNSVFNIPLTGRPPLNNANGNEIHCLGEQSSDLVSDTSNPNQKKPHTDTVNLSQSGDKQNFAFSWKARNSNQEQCSAVSVFKFFEPLPGDGIGPDMSGALRKPPGTVRCAEGFICTVIQSRGYNAKCTDRYKKGVIEREITRLYR